MYAVGLGSKNVISCGQILWSVTFPSFLNPYTLVYDWHWLVGESGWLSIHRASAKSCPPLSFSLSWLPVYTGGVQVVVGLRSAGGGKIGLG